MDETLKLRPSRMKWGVIAALFAGLIVLFVYIFATTPRRNPPDDSFAIIGFLIVLFAIGTGGVYLDLHFG
jgi:ABC-type multidrug transport system permease subunit